MRTSNPVRPSVGAGAHPSRVPAPEANALTVALLAIAVLAWLLMIQQHGLGVHGPEGIPLGASGQAAPGAHDHSAHGLALRTGVPQEAQSLFAAPALWLWGWSLMVLAMMLPPALPLLRVVQRLVSAHPRRFLFLLVTTLAFVGVWILVGILLLLASTLFGNLASHSQWLLAHPEVPSGLAAIVAGAYQFTPLKSACLSACRSPTGLVMTTWSGTRSPVREVAHIGWLYGLVCAGCCWALMLLSFLVGTLALPLMVVTGVVMAAERLLPKTRPVVPLAALGAVSLGVLILLRLLPPGLLA